MWRWTRRSSSDCSSAVSKSAPSFSNAACRGRSSPRHDDSLGSDRRGDPRRRSPSIHRMEAPARAQRGIKSPKNRRPGADGETRATVDQSQETIGNMPARRADPRVPAVRPGLERGKNGRSEIEERCRHRTLAQPPQQRTQLVPPKPVENLSALIVDTEFDAAFEVWRSVKPYIVE